MLPFVKMHALGNDYVYLNAVANPSLASRRDLPKLARAISDRNFGVGSDGLILLCKPRTGSRAHVAMRMFNADGSESDMCGNGVRCVAKFAHDRLGIRRNPMLVETGAKGRGLVNVSYRTSRGKLTTACVDMGEPVLELQNIPVDRKYITRGRKPFEWKIELPDAEAGGAELLATFVSMGNPHAVIFPLGSLDDVDLPAIGPQLEEHPAFPDRINAHFVEVHRKSEASMITWERGTGPTLACGSGACAVLVAGVLTGRLARSAILHLPGGDLRIQWDEDTNHIFMTGPASDAFEGVWPEKARTKAKDQRRA